MRASAPLVLVMILIACASDTPVAPGGPVDARVVLAPGETADVRGASTCFLLQGEWATYDLHSGNMQPVRHGDLTIALIAIAPYPYSNRPIGPGDYRATLGVSR